MPKRSSQPVRVNAGSFEFLKVNGSGWEWRDLYHSLLTLSTGHFILVILAAYLAINVFFAALYSVGGQCLEGMPPGSFLLAFFFSVETFATVGYGHIYPATTYGHVIATLEIMAGMFATAAVTGLIFVRFSRPTARLQFSSVMVVAPFDGTPALMFRVANERHQPMAEAEFRLILLRNEATREDPSLRRFHALPLQVDRLIAFPAALTMRHLITEGSPLYGLSPEKLAGADVRFSVSVVCIDKVIPAPVQSDHAYTWREVRFGERFVEMYHDDEEGRLVADYGQLSVTEPVPG